MRRHRRQRSRSRTLKPKVGDVSVGDAVSSSRRGTHCGEPFGWLSHLAAAANGKQATVELGREAARAAATLFPAEATLHCWLASAASTSPHCVRSSSRPGWHTGAKQPFIYCLHVVACRGGKLGEYGRVGCAGRRARPGNTAHLPRLLSPSSPRFRAQLETACCMPEHTLVRVL